MSEAKSVKVEAKKYHTFNGKEYDKGDTYTVKGDGHTTLEQYLDTLRVTGFAYPVGEESPRIVDEVGSPEEDAAQRAAEAKAAAKAAPKDDEPKKAKADKDTSVEPMSTENSGLAPKAKTDLKAEAEQKTVEHRKPAQHVSTVKK